MKDTSNCIAQLQEREYYEASGQWFLTDCGFCMLLEEDEEDYKFCPYCGKPLILDDHDISMEERTQYIEDWGEPNED